MRRLCGSYVYWYNTKYRRVGNLFQDRFKSEAVEDDQYFQTVLRYIHQNPVKAGLVKCVEEYKWSSMQEYINQAKFVNVNLPLEMISCDREKRIEKFIEYTNGINEDKCLDTDNEAKKRIMDDEAREIIKMECTIKNAMELQQFDCKTRNRYLKTLEDKHSLSIRQIERLTGINRGVILKA
jgi:hypothetical protein